MNASSSSIVVGSEVTVHQQGLRPWAGVVIDKRGDVCEVQRAQSFGGVPSRTIVNVSALVAR